jgi:GntR family transcriptional repressor for pyruvate dehydrogenase complex
MDRRGAQGGGSLVQRAMRAITDHIRDQDLRVGDTLPGEAHFATELGVSLAVMRVGAMDASVMATSLDHAVSTAQITVAEVWDVRRTLELRTVALAAHNRTEAEAAEIAALVEAMARDHADMDRMTEHDVAFHQAIARASHNMLFVQIVASFEQLMHEAVPTAWQTRVAVEQHELVLDRHRQVARAIAERNPTLAVAAMEAHFDASIGDILRGLDRS